MVWLCELPYKPVFVHASSENLSLYRAGGFCLFYQDCIPENNGVAKVPVKAAGPQQTLLLPLPKPVMLKPCLVVFCDQIPNHTKWMSLCVLAGMILCP